MVWCGVIFFNDDASQECSCLQEQTEEMEKVKEELHQEVEELKQGKLILKNELDERLKEIHRLRVCVLTQINPSGLV